MRYLDYTGFSLEPSNQDLAPPRKTRLSEKEVDSESWCAKRAKLEDAGQRPGRERQSNPDGISQRALQPDTIEVLP